MRCWQPACFSLACVLSTGRHLCSSPVRIERCWNECSGLPLSWMSWRMPLWWWSHPAGCTEAQTVLSVSLQEEKKGVNSLFTSSSLHFPSCCSAKKGFYIIYIFSLLKRAIFNGVVLSTKTSHIVFTLPLSTRRSWLFLLYIQILSLLIGWTVLRLIHRAVQPATPLILSMSMDGAYIWHIYTAMSSIV